MNTKLVTAFASVLLTGSAALAFLPSLQPQPTSPLAAAAAPTLQGDEEPELTCRQQCEKDYDDALSDLEEDASECEENATSGARAALSLCFLLSDPQAVNTCIGVVRAIHAQELANCNSTLDAETQAAFNDYVHCLENCPA